ncbi:MAG: DUF2569 family protein [Bacteroidales bacterium]|nr:DUF2569 family protein [Bacteroidales bacterium]
MIQDQCDKCNKRFSCTENKVFDSASCPYYSKGINLEKENYEKSSDEGSTQFQAEEQKTGSTTSSSITQESLKATTNIHGWLTFFLISIILGGIISAVYPLATLDLSEYDGDVILAFADVIMGILIFALAILTVVSFSNRKPDAVFLAKTYIIVVFAMNLLSLAIGDFDDTGFDTMPRVIRSLIWSVIWFCYLCFSKQVQEVIPKEYRKKSKFDYWVIGILIFVPFFSYVYAFVSVYNEPDYKYDATEITSVRFGEYSDGKIAFSLPTGFECSSSDHEGLKVFELSNPGLASIILVSDFDDDQSARNINDYWTSFEDDDASQYPKDLVVNEKRYVNNMPYYYKVTKYLVDGTSVYWRFILLFDNASSKMCLLSCYDNGYNSYVEELLQTIRFR